MARKARRAGGRAGGVKKRGRKTGSYTGPGKRKRVRRAKEALDIFPKKRRRKKK